MELIRTCGLRHAVWQMTQTTSEQSGGGSCSQYFCSIPFPCSSWYKSSQYPFHLSVICAASVKFLLVADSIHCRRGYSFRVIDLTIWKSCLEFPFEFAVSNSSTCLPAVAVYRLWAFSLPQPSVLDYDIGSYLCLLLPSFRWLLQKSHQISTSFSFATWRIQSFLWLLPAGLSWYPSSDLLGLPHPVQPPMP